MKGVLSTICSVFDPLNLAAPVVLPAKQIMQELWKLKRAWETLEGKLLQRWLQLGKMTNLFWRRWTSLDVTLVGLTMKELLYSFINSATRPKLDATAECAFVIGKSRNAPSMYWSCSEKKNWTLSLKKWFFRTDSIVVLNYIHNENNWFKTYVANQVREIRDLTSP